MPLKSDLQNINAKLAESKHPFISFVFFFLYLVVRFEREK